MALIQQTCLLGLVRFLPSSGSSGDDLITGTENNDLILGLQGSDSIRGEGGADVIQGDEDPDKLYGGNDNDIIQGGQGSDLVYGGMGDDILTGGLDDDMLSGDNGNDKLYGGEGDDVLQGGPGADYFDCGDGIDIVIDSNVSEGDDSAGNCEELLNNIVLPSETGQAGYNGLNIMNENESQNKNQIALKVSNISKVFVSKVEKLVALRHIRLCGKEGRVCINSWPIRKWQVHSS